MLYSKNLKFRSLKIDDLKFINEWRNDLYTKIMSQGYRLPVTKIQDEDWMRMKMSNTHGNEVFFIVEEITGTIPIGLIQLTNIDYISGTAVWGFIIGDKTQRKKGYSVEALHLLLEYAFNILNLRKIFGYPIEYNKATLRMHAKIGIVHEEGRLKRHYFLNGKYYDVLILSVFREDYPNIYPKKDDSF